MVNDVKQSGVEAGYPYIVFRIKKNLFAINSRNLTSIMQLPKYVNMPRANSGVRGVFMYRGSTATLFDMRVLLEVEPMSQEYASFVSMIDQRKSDHINWVNELERTIKANEAFKLATDPHKCAFGKWYDNFEIENNAIMLHLKKIKEPHDKLHAAAHEVEHCKRECEDCKNVKCLRQVMIDLKDVYMPKILGLLDETKELFRDVYNEMVLMLGAERPIGITVDEVLGVEELYDVDNTDGSGIVIDSPYVSGLKKSKRIEGIILEIKEDVIVS